MRTTILTRSVVAFATLAVGSVALAATPANAAAANGVTRDEVLTAVNGVRAAAADDSQYSFATARALQAIVNRGCDVRYADGERTGSLTVQPATAGDDADGLMISTYVGNQFGGSSCTIAAFATADPTFKLSGTAVISGATSGTPTTAPKVLLSQALSGDAFVTTALDTEAIDEETLTAAAAGDAVKTTTTKTSTKVADKKTKAEKKKAKASYTKRIKSAKKSYAKALDKAGKSNSKKTKAKKAYSAKRASAKSTYKYAVASYKIVKKTTSSTEKRPFSITVAAQPQPQSQS